MQHAIRACCLSEAIVNHISAPAVRKVYSIKQAIMIFCQLDMVLDNT